MAQPQAFEGEGSERLMNSVSGGLIGGAIGGVAPAALSAGASLGRVGREIVAPIFSTTAGERIALDNANRQVGRSLALGSHTPAQAAAEVNSRGAMGVPASPADIPDAARALGQPQRISRAGTISRAGCGSS